MKRVNIINTTYYLPQDCNVDMNIFQVDAYYPSRDQCIGLWLENPFSTSIDIQKPEKIEKLKEIWTIDTVRVKYIETTLIELYERGKTAFAIDYRYWKGGNMIHFPYPYWDYRLDIDKVQFKSTTLKIIDELEQISYSMISEDQLSSTLKDFMEYERFCINHTGTLCELFKDYYDKYIKNYINVNDNFYPYYAIYYYLVRLGYWFDDYQIIKDELDNLYISIDDDQVYLDVKINDEEYSILEKFFAIRLPIYPSPDDE